MSDREAVDARDRVETVEVMARALRERRPNYFVRRIPWEYEAAQVCYEALDALIVAPRGGGAVGG